MTEIKKKRINKYLYGFKLYVNYGHGWEYEVFEESLREIKQRVKEYRENTPYPVKWSSGREINGKKRVREEPSIYIKWSSARETNPAYRGK